MMYTNYVTLNDVMGNTTYFCTQGSMSVPREENRGWVNDKVIGNTAYNTSFCSSDEIPDSPIDETSALNRTWISNYFESYKWTDIGVNIIDLFVQFEDWRLWFTPSNILFSTKQLFQSYSRINNNGTYDWSSNQPNGSSIYTTFIGSDENLSNRALKVFYVKLQWLNDRFKKIPFQNCLISLTSIPLKMIDLYIYISRWSYMLNPRRLIIGL